MSTYYDDTELILRIYLIITGYFLDFLGAAPSLGRAQRHFVLARAC